MGSIDNGIFGAFKGKIGNLVSYNLKGKHVVRIIGRSTKPPTEGQLAEYQKMTVVNAFLKPILGFINSGFSFAVEGSTKNPYNEALSYNKKNALQGQYPDITLDYTKAMVSTGLLEPPFFPTVNLIANGIEFTWQVSSNVDWGIKNDRAMLLVFFPQKNEAIYILSGARRADGRDVIPLNPDQLNQSMACYISFMADDRKSVSNSVWAKP